MKSRNQKPAASQDAKKSGPSQDVKKHTPGPWRLASCGLGQNSAVFTENGFFCVADCNNSLSTSFDPEVNQANARLIAAAPELLAAYEGAAFAIGECKVGEHAMADLFPKKLEALQSAIAKATGKAVQS